MLMVLEQQQNLPHLLRDGLARHILPRSAQHHQSRERLVRTSLAFHTDDSSTSFPFRVGSNLEGCMCVAPKP